MNPRKYIFDEVKRLRGGAPFTLAEVKMLDLAINKFLSASVSAGAVEHVATKLEKPAGFFDHMRGTRVLGPVLSQQEVDGCQIILAACGQAGWPVAWVAYALATAFHETAGTMQPIKEYGRGRGKRYGKPGKHGQIAYGRGFVQLTWDYNYEKADRELSLGGRLIADYDLALRHDIAASILVRGMAEGWFTSKKLSDFLPLWGVATKEQFRLARPIINRRDDELLIAGYAIEFQKALVAGEWK